MATSSPIDWRSLAEEFVGGGESLDRLARLMTRLYLQGLKVGQHMHEGEAFQFLGHFGTVDEHLRRTEHPRS